MSKKRTRKPEFYSTFMKAGFFPNANKITKFEESENYWMFKTGSKIHKVKKKGGATSTISLEEIFCNEICRQIQLFSPHLEPRVYTIKKMGDEFTVDWDNTIPSAPSYFLISLNQLTDKGFLDNIVKKNKLKERMLDKIVTHLYNFHQATKVSSSKDDGSPDSLSIKLDDLYYQSKKYLNETITKAMIDMTDRPLEKYLNDNRKTFSRRIKRGLIRQTHGCFVPRKIHYQKDQISFLARTSDPLKNRFTDVASDVSDLTVELEFAGEKAMSDYFVDRYIEISDDRELKQVLPIYQAMRCLHLGLRHSLDSRSEYKQQEEEKACAVRYYEQTIEVVRAL